jgi:hypothetical protein
MSSVYHRYGNLWSAKPLASYGIGMTLLLLTLLDVFIITATVIGAIAAVKLIGSSTKAGVAALGIMLLGVFFTMLDSFALIDSHYRDGGSEYIRLAFDAPFCECHSTRSGDTISTTCSPPDCGGRPASPPPHFPPP